MVIYRLLDVRRFFLVLQDYRLSYDWYVKWEWVGCEDARTRFHVAVGRIMIDQITKVVSPNPDGSIGREGQVTRLLFLSDLQTYTPDMVKVYLTRIPSNRRLSSPDN